MKLQWAIDYAKDHQQNDVSLSYEAAEETLQIINDLEERLQEEIEKHKVEIEHILGEVRWYAGKDNFYTIKQSLEIFREDVTKL